MKVNALQQWSWGTAVRTSLKIQMRTPKPGQSQTQGWKTELLQFHPNCDSSVNGGLETNYFCGHRQALTTSLQFHYLQNINNYTYLPQRNLVQHRLASTHLFKPWAKLRSNFEHLHKLKPRVKTTQRQRPAKAQQQQNPRCKTRSVWRLLLRSVTRTAPAQPLHLFGAQLPARAWHRPCPPRSSRAPREGVTAASRCLRPALPRLPAGLTAALPRLPLRCRGGRARRLALSRRQPGPESAAASSSSSSSSSRSPGSRLG